MMGRMLPGIGMCWMLPLLCVFAALVLMVVRRKGGFVLFGGRRADVSEGKGEQSIETKIMRLAARRDGELTVTDVVVETGLPVPKAEELLDKMVDGRRVSMRVNDSGIVTYEFPEILHRSHIKDKPDEPDL